MDKVTCFEVYIFYIYYNRGAPSNAAPGGRQFHYMLFYCRVDRQGSRIDRFGDGGEQVETWTVTGVLKEVGYEVQTADLGLHSHVISAIKKGGI